MFGEGSQFLSSVSNEERLADLRFENGYQIELNLVDHCNLNCAGCNHFAPLSAPKEVSLTELEESMLLLKEKLPSLYRLMLVGGEPLLHSDLFGCIKIIHKIFPRVLINIFTNGILLLKKDSQYFKDFKSENAEFFITLYPYIDYQPLYDTLKDAFGDRGSQYFDQRMRIMMNSTLVNIRPVDYAKNYFSCEKQSLPCLMLRGKNIFLCPFAATIDIFNKAFNKNIPIASADYLALQDISSYDDLRDFCLKPKPMCGYCRSNDDPYLWHKSSKSLEEFTLPNDKRIRLHPELNDTFYVNNNLCNYLLRLTIGGLRPIENLDLKFNHDFAVKLLERLNVNY